MYAVTFLKFNRILKLIRPSITINSKHDKIWAIAFVIDKKKVLQLYDK